MSYEDIIENLKKAIEQKQTELEALQITVNQLCKLDNKPPLYNVTSGYGKSEVPQEKDLKGDEYYGKPLATVITEILQKRKDNGMGPATMNEICDRMKKGGYIFDVKDPLRAIGISMGKNQKFTKLPNEKWGLTDWYPNVKEKKQILNNKEETIEVIDGVETTKSEQEEPIETPRRKRGRPKKEEEISGNTNKQE